MNRLFTRTLLLFGSLIFVLILNACKENHREEGEHEAYDAPRQIAHQLHDAMMDPATGKVPQNALWDAIDYTDQLKRDIRSHITAANKGTSLPAWTERGPNSDVTGGSSGNPRANSGVASGRIRAIWVDLADNTGNTVWIGGVDGGLWKTTSIDVSPAGWSVIDDRFNNLAISSICQDPTNTNTMYFATGEPTFNIDAVDGVGVFKSTDHGVTWAPLVNTSSFTNCSKIICDAVGNVYLATIGNGLQRSNDGGNNWTNISPTGFGNNYTDIQISNTTGTLHAVSGYFEGPARMAYHRTTTPSSVTAATWGAATTPYSHVDRVIISCKGSDVLLVPSDSTTDNVLNIYRSTNDGVNWAALSTVPAGASSQQGWYCLAADIDPSNSANMIMGGLDCFRTTNTGTSWSQVSTWVGTTPVNQYVHADQQFMVWYSASAQSRILVACDGGLFLSTDGGTTWRDRNVGLRIKQFYSCDINPNVGSNIFLAGAQDNGTHQFSAAGLGSTTEVKGGDGMFVHIDQDQPQFMFGSYTNNQYNRSTNTGSTWGDVTLSATTGSFINPTDYDDAANIMYCCNTAGTYRRWTNPQSGSTSASVTITALGTSTVTAVKVNPYKSGTVYFGTNTGKVVKVNTANTAPNNTAGIDLSTGLPGGTIHCIAIGSDSNHIAVTYSNYNINNVWISIDGGASWTASDNNLPNMPVWWAVFDPASNTKLIIGTETGVWITGALNGVNTHWVPDINFPNVSTQMLKIRPSDNTIAAATHGRGLWTSTVTATALPIYEFDLNATNNGRQINLSWNYVSARSGILFDVETTDDGIHFTTVKTVAQNSAASYTASLPFAEEYVRIKAYDTHGYTEYSKMIRITSNNKLSALTIRNLYPNPAKDVINFSVDIPAGSQVVNFGIYDITGRMVLQSNSGGKTGAVNMNYSIASLPSGQYILKASNGKEVAVMKFVKL